MVLSLGSRRSKEDIKKRGRFASEMSKKDTARDGPRERPTNARVLGKQTTTSSLHWATVFWHGDSAKKKKKKKQAKLYCLMLQEEERECTHCLTVCPPSPGTARGEKFKESVCNGKAKSVLTT